MRLTESPFGYVYVAVVSGFERRKGSCVGGAWAKVSGVYEVECANGIDFCGLYRLEPYLASSLLPPRETQIDRDFACVFSEEGLGTSCWTCCDVCGGEESRWNGFVSVHTRAIGGVVGVRLGTTGLECSCQCRVLVLVPGVCHPGSSAAVIARLDALLFCHRPSYRDRGRSLRSCRDYSAHRAHAPLFVPSHARAGAQLVAV